MAVGIDDFLSTATTTSSRLKQDENKKLDSSWPRSPILTPIHFSEGVKRRPPAGKLFKRTTRGTTALYGVGTKNPRVLEERQTCEAPPINSDMAAGSPTPNGQGLSQRRSLRREVWRLEKRWKRSEKRSRVVNKKLMMVNLPVVVMMVAGSVSWFP